MSDDLTIAGDAKRIESDAKLLKKAIRNRWPVTDEVRKAVIDRLEGFIKDPFIDPDRATAAARVIVAAEGQNQADDHLREKNERIDGGKATDATEVRVLKVEFDS